MKKTKGYFTKETEEYIVKYNQSKDPDEKNRIFTEHIYYPFYKLAENIIHTFKFYKLDNDSIENLKYEIVSMLHQEKIAKFDPSKGSKAFSYFGTIVKRWLIAYCNRNYDKENRQVPLDSFIEKSEDESSFEIAPTLTLSGFIDNWVAEMYCKLDEMFPKDSDKQIADALLTIMRTRQDLDIISSKKALYVYVREITGSETPYITKVLLKLKKEFQEKYQKFYDEGLISVD